MIKLHQQELEHIINPLTNTIIEQLGGSQVKSHLLDGFMPGDPQEIYEEIAKDKKALAITVTYKPKYQMLENEDMRKIVISNLSWIYNNPHISCQTLLVPDEDINGNYHYHGVIVIRRKDIRKFKRYMTIFNGYMKTSYIEDTTKWKEYIFKSYNGNHPKCPEQLYTMEELKQLSVVYNSM